MKVLGTHASRNTISQRMLKHISRMATRPCSINFMGDVMLGRLIDQLYPQHVDEPSEAEIARSITRKYPRLSRYGPDTPWSDTISILHRADLNIINLETSVTTHAVKWPNKVFNYRMHPDNLGPTLDAAKISYAGLANNHSLDFSEAGLAETVATVRRAGVAFAGAGDSPAEATKPAILSLPGSKDSSPYQICIWAAADHPREWKRVSGFHFIDYTSQTKQRLKDLIFSTTPRGTALKVFSLHWGPNYSWQPAEEIQDLAHFLIDECDVDIIHGHSSHHVQGVEIYKGKLIIYGCGDFVDDYALVPEYRNDLSGIWQVKVEEAADKKGMNVKRLEVYPTKIDKFVARRLRPEEADSEWVREKIVKLSSELGTQAVVEPGGDGSVVFDLN